VRQRHRDLRPEHRALAALRDLFENLGALGEERRPGTLEIEGEADIVREIVLREPIGLLARRNPDADAVSFGRDQTSPDP
jgi:hypothetical protein